jgi:hypothetical protein
MAGLAVMAIGVFFLFFGSGLRPGTLSRMGPGFVPIAVSCIMIGLGAIIAVQSFWKTAEPVDWPLFRPLLVVLACPVLFALLIGPVGLVGTILIVATVGRLAQPQRFSLETVLVPVLLTIFCVVLFTYLLNLPIPLWPRS